MIRDILDAFIKPRVWPHDRTRTIGSSEIGGCIRRTYYTKTQHKPDDDHVARWGATERGNIYENNLWTPALRKAFGDKLKYAGEEQQTFESGRLSATPDGLLVGIKRNVLSHLGVKDIGANCLSLECKTIDPRVNLVEAKHQNMMQVQIAMGVVREKTPYRPNYALISYANASFLDDITEFAVEYDQKIYDQAKRRASQIYAAKNASALKPEGYIKGGKDCEHCPFVKLCGVERHNLPSAKFAAEKIDPQLRAEFIDMVRDANKVKVQREAFDEQFKDAQETIKLRLREKNIRKIDGVLSWIDVKGRQAYDVEALVAAARKKGINTEKFSRVGEPTSRLTLMNVGKEL